MSIAKPMKKVSPTIKEGGSECLLVPDGLSNIFSTSEHSISEHWAKFEDRKWAESSVTDNLLQWDLVTKRRRRSRLHRLRVDEQMLDRY